MNIIILGDKFQKRMKSKGCVGLFRSDNDYLIIKQYKVLKKIFPQAKIIYVYGFEHKKLLITLDQYPAIKTDIELIYNADYDFYNYGASLEIAKNYLDDDTIIMFGDTIVDKNLFMKFDLKEQASQIIINNRSNNKLGCVINKLKIENIFYDLDNKIEEIYLFCKQDAKIMHTFLNNKSQAIKNMFIFEIVNQLIDMQVNIKPLPHTMQYKITRTKRKNVT
jgi:choline kinase